MFKKILIANRGEIACRIIKTARKMGIATVAVYADADAQSLHVQMADEAVHIGGSASSDSYLRIDRILAATAQTHAEAVHPGFGFLSENAEFAKALEQAGVAFIGPGIHAIATMGDKIESKTLADKVGVNTIPGHTQAIKDASEALGIAGRVGCPVMIKASAGGGGKGMRIAWSLDQVEEGFNSARNEARNSFGDDRVFIEKYIESPRHIEIQVLADTHGECVYLGERECSIQRRHQKVIEEAPSPFIDPATRQSMGAQAVTLARAVDYASAGTVEFIVDKHRQFYFLEMNTRLQVEHPVTEYITGIDLVEQMIRVAAGLPLGISQSDVTLNGWAIEARVYAEDPVRNFMPSTGRLTHYQPPTESDCVRVDTGVYEGGEISMHYDPMIAKLVVKGETREQAITTISDALDAYVIRGVAHNIPFLASVMRQDDFIQGKLSTNFIEKHYPQGFDNQQPPGDALYGLLAIAATLQQQIDTRENPGAQQCTVNYQATVDGLPPVDEQNNGQNNATFSLTSSITEAAEGFVVQVDKQHFAIKRDWHPGQHRVNAAINGGTSIVQVQQDKLFWQLTSRGFTARIAVLRPHIASLYQLMPEKIPTDTSQFLLSPMPGLLVRLLVEVGDHVEAGQDLALVEAMKMENTLCAERAGVIASINAAQGDSLSVDQVILEFE